MRFIAEAETEGFHFAQELTLGARYPAKQGGQSGLIPGKRRPVRLLPDVQVIISALIAENKWAILRIDSVGDILPRIAPSKVRCEGAPVIERKQCLS